MPASNLIGILDDLVGFASVSNDLIGCEECFRYVRRYLGAHDLYVSLMRSQKYPSLVALTRPGNKRPKVMLAAHLDVVPAKSSCFKPSQKAGRLYGRGVYDMKFAAACYLQLIEDLKDELGHYDFGLMLTADEEIGGQNGVGFLLKKGYGADVCILPDAGDNWQIETSCNGVWIAKLQAAGKSAHGSRPWEGDNAIDHLLDALQAIRQLFPEPAAGKDSLTVSLIEGGQAHNQVPDAATATLDMRFTDEHQKLAMQAKIERLAKASGLKLRTIADVGCVETDLKHAPIKDFIEVAERIRGQPVGQTKSFGASDARFFSAHGIPTILIRPEGGGAHGDGEWIDKAGLLQFYEVLKAYVTGYARIS